MGCHDEKRTAGLDTWSWSSRLVPSLVVALLASTHKLSQFKGLDGHEEAGNMIAFTEFALVITTTVFTGYLRMPFSVTWWLLVFAAFVFETKFIIGVVTVLALSILLSWYGTCYWYPPTVSALWGGAAGGGMEKPRVSRALWQAWDILVHFVPCVLMLYSCGPSLTTDSNGRIGLVPSSVVTPLAAVTSLPLNVVWLWGVGFGSSSKQASKQWGIWPLGGARLRDTNKVYNIAPEIPDEGWKWAFGIHWAACAVWTACLVLPFDVMLAYTIFGLFGFAWQPFTTAWWLTFSLSLLAEQAVGDLFRGMVACCGATMVIGWYGARCLEPRFFMAMVVPWGVDPIKQWAPRWISAKLPNTLDKSIFLMVAKISDILVHLVPAGVACMLYRAEVTAAASLASVPCNIIYWFSTRTASLAETNKLYGAVPEPPTFVWKYIYSSHVVFCLAVCVLTLSHQALVDPSSLPTALSSL